MKKNRKNAEDGEKEGVRELVLASERVSSGVNEEARASGGGCDPLHSHEHSSL